MYVCPTMKRNVTQRGKATGNSSAPVNPAQASIELKIRALEARKAFIELGVEDYMSLIVVQANREGKSLDVHERKAIRQVLNGRVFSGDIPRLELIQRALEAAA